MAAYRPLGRERTIRTTWADPDLSCISKLADVCFSQYQPGFGNSFESEAVPGENSSGVIFSFADLTEALWVIRDHPERTK